MSWTLEIPNLGLTVEVPDGVSGDDPRLQQQIAEYAQQKLRQEQAISAEPTSDPRTTIGGQFGGIVRGVGPVGTAALVGAGMGAPLGPAGMAAGAATMAGATALGAPVVDSILNALSSVLGTKIPTVHDGFKMLFDRLGVPEPDTAAERVVQTTAQALAGGGGNVAAGRAMQAAGGATMRATGQALAAQPAQQLAGAATGGAAQQAAQEAGIGPAGQIAAGLGASMLGARAAAPRSAATQSAKSLIREGERHGVPIMTTDAVPPQTRFGQALRSIGSDVPIVGTASTYKAQAKSRIDAVRNLLRSFGADDAANARDEIFSDLSTRRSGQIQRLVGQKRDVIDRLSEKGSVPLPRTIRQIDRQIESIQRQAPESGASVISKLEQWKRELSDQDLNGIEAMRDIIGEAFSAPELSAIRKFAEKRTSSIYRPLIADMGEFIKKRGSADDFRQWKTANRRLHKMARELESNVLKSTLKAGDASPEVVDRMLFSQRPSDVKALYKGLGEKGRQAARSAILNRALEKSLRGRHPESLSPKLFSNEVQRLGEQIGVFFSSGDRARIEGLGRVIRSTQYAAEFAAHPPTGVQHKLPVVTAVLAGLLGGPKAAAATLAIGGGAARIVESKPVRDILIRIPRTVPGSTEEAALVKRALSLMQTQADSITATMRPIE